jgi:hypothetical protein
MLAKSSIVFGACVISATAVNAGSLPPMDNYNLENFRVDCRKKQQQWDFLMAQRTESGVRSTSRLTNFVTPWRYFTDPETYAYNDSLGRGRLDWLIDNHLNHLRDCP